MIKFRKYGKPPYNIILVHGGPGAPGEMASVAKELSGKFGVLEPFQSGLSIQDQVLELKSILDDNGNPPYILIGWSWGAWLSTIFSAQYPDLIKKLILISSGPFEQKYSKNIMKTRLNRLNIKERQKVNFLINNCSNVSDMKALEELVSKADSYDSLPYKKEILEYQYDIFISISMKSTFLRNSGKLLEYAKKIKCPTVAIHGDYDPHPFEGVRYPLSKFIGNFRFILIEKCGHHPWYELFAMDEFYKILLNEINSN
jgi:pimeloyl-ACP methyl ester carboxylesterase